MLPIKDQIKAQGLDQMLVNMLQEVQDDCKEQIIINEGIPENVAGSHVVDSEHFEGKGVDVSAKYGLLRMKIVRSALKVGFKRIGVYNRHVHLGISTTLPQDVIWGGVSA